METTQKKLVIRFSDKKIVLVFLMALSLTFLYLINSINLSDEEPKNKYIENIKNICNEENGKLVSFHKEYLNKKYFNKKSDNFKILIICRNKNEK